MTITDLLDRYVAGRLMGRASYASALRVRRTVVAWEGVDPTTVTRQQVQQWYASFADRPGAGYKALGLLRASVRYCQRIGYYVGPDYTLGVQRGTSATRRRFVMPAEVPRLTAALSASPLPRRAFCLMILLTGARPKEVRLAEWRHLDLSAGLWWKPTTKTGQPQCAPLSAQLVAVLRVLPKGSPFLFPGGRLDRPMAESTGRKWWTQVRALAGLPDVWNYDLRRTTASHLALRGENLSVIQHALNHTSLAPTSRYAYLHIEPVKLALQGLADSVVGAPVLRTSEGPALDDWRALG